jgi:two-component system, OmpR family, KDP operon response regulator KdpE
MTPGEAVSKVLLIDAESRDADALDRALTQDGYDVLRTSDLSCAAAKFAEWQPSVVIADIYLPEGDGLAVCRELRRMSETPILIVSNASHERMIVDALDAGADDYVVKPFCTREMLARLRSALRRHRLRGAETPAVEIGEFRIDVSGYRVYVRGQPVKLTPKEFDLLTYMARRPGRVLSHGTLAREMWRADTGSDPAPLRVLMGNLRKKIESDPGRPRHLITHARVGYAFQPYLTAPTDDTTSQGRGLNFDPSGSRL